MTAGWSLLCPRPNLVGARPVTTCIYCGGPDPFTAEHVLARAFVGEGDNLVLNDLVCRICNTKRFSACEREWTAFPAWPWHVSTSGLRGARVAVDSKLRGCDLVQLRIGQLVLKRRGSAPRHDRPAEDPQAVQIELYRPNAGKPYRLAYSSWGRAAGLRVPQRTDSADHISTRQYAPIGGRLGREYRSGCVRPMARTAFGGRRWH